MTCSKISLPQRKYILQYKLSINFPLKSKTCLCAQQKIRKWPQFVAEINGGDEAGEIHCTNCLEMNSTSREMNYFSQIFPVKNFDIYMYNHA